MVHISDILAEAQKGGKPSFSFEYFPPKTAQGVQNLYDRIERMSAYGNNFIDITWGAGGRHAELTCEMVHTAQSVYGMDVLMHLTCKILPFPISLLLLTSHQVPTHHERRLTAPSIVVTRPVAPTSSHSAVIHHATRASGRLQMRVFAMPRTSSSTSEPSTAITLMWESLGILKVVTTRMMPIFCSTI